MGWFKEYLWEFENAMVRGVRIGVLGSDKAVQVQPGKLSRRKIGRILGIEVETDEPMAIDYYGFIKKSRGFNVMVKEVIADVDDGQVKTVNAKMVHFNGVRLEVLAKIAPNLVEKFGEFKKAVLDAREFKHNYKA